MRHCEHFVTYDCGCIGLGADSSGYAVIVKPCHGDTEYSIYLGDMSGKTAEPLPLRDAIEIREDLASLVSDGYNMRTVRGLVK